MNNTIEVKKDPKTKDLYIELSDELLEKLGWKTGDNIEWIDNKDDSWTLKKCSNEQ